MRIARSLLLLLALVLAAFTPHGAATPESPPGARADVLDVPHATQPALSLSAPGEARNDAPASPSAMHHGESSFHAASLGVMLLGVWVAGSFLLGVLWALVGWTLGRPGA